MMNRSMWLVGVAWMMLATAVGEASVGSQQYYESLTTLPLIPAASRSLQATPAEEEGHAQQVDALYQGAYCWCF